MYEIKKYYRSNAALRQSFNRLAEATFGLNFENWYQNGFWGENYDPYSVVINGEVVANVSVNRTDLLIGGTVRQVFQLGTVMTAEEHRNRGYIRAIMAEIEQDLQEAYGVYLFANDSVLDFYPKFGFTRGTEYVWFRTVAQTGPCTLEKVPMDGPEGWVRLQKAMEDSTFPTACRMENNPGLIFFYVSQFMQDCVFYDRALDAWVIAEQEEDSLFLHDVFASRPVTLEQILAAFGSSVRQVTLGFTPADPTGFTYRELQEEDCTFFVKGPVFRDFAAQKLRIPSLSHA